MTYRRHLDGNQPSRTIRGHFVHGRVGCWVGLLLVGLAAGAEAGQPAPNVEVLVNQVGYLPGAKKTVVVQSTSDHGKKAGSLEVFQASARVYSGQLEYAGQLWGRHCWVGDFTPLATPGKYCGEGIVVRRGQRVAALCHRCSRL